MHIPYSKNSKNQAATLGTAVFDLVGLAPLTPAQAQESYIIDTDESAACEGVCNTFVPPQTEEECRSYGTLKSGRKRTNKSLRLAAWQEHAKKNGMNPMEYSSTRTTRFALFGTKKSDQRKRLTLLQQRDTLRRMRHAWLCRHLL